MNDSLTPLRVSVCAVLILLGIIAHFVKRLYDLEQTGTILSPISFVRMHPYAFVSTILSAYLLGAFWYFIGQLNEVTAILTGVACNSAFDTLRARAIGKLQPGPENEPNENGVR